MIELAIAAIAVIGGAVGQCPEDIVHVIAFSSDAETDRLIISQSGAACTELGIRIEDAAGQVVFTHEPDLECARDAQSARAFANDIYDADEDYYGTRAEDLPPESEHPPIRYFFVNDYDLYGRAVDTGGPLVCFRSYDFGRACAWFDPESGAGTILFEMGD